METMDDFREELEASFKKIRVPAAAGQHPVQKPEK